MTKTYAKSRQRAVDDLSLRVESGEIFGFLGPNGAGKSTTIKMLCGILLPDAGRITVDGKDLSREPVEVKMKIGYVSDNHNVYERLTGIEFLNFMADVYRVSEADRKSRIDYYLQLFGLTEAASSQIKSYSHGMKQKICIAGALVHNPSLWVLDEPLTGLDPQSAFNLKEMMKEHCRQGNTVFFSSHVLEVVEKVCDRVGIIDHGRLIAVGTLDELREKGTDLEQYFLRLTNVPPTTLPPSGPFPTQQIPPEGWGGRR